MKHAQPRYGREIELPNTMNTNHLLLSLALCSSLLSQQDPEEAEAASSVATAEASFPLVDSAALRALRSQQDARAQIAARIWPGIVTVRVYERFTPDKEEPVIPEGGWVQEPEISYPGYREYDALSGWVVAEEGEILTCNHGLLKKDGSAPDLIEIETNDYQRILAERVGIEPTVNIAILQAVVWPNGHSKKLPTLQWGNSEACASGHTLLAFGDPSGPARFLQQATFVAQPSRDCYQDLLSAFYMQVGMIAHPQSYGGPLIDLSGRVVGIIAPRQSSPGRWAASNRFGVEFALPSKIVKNLYEAIRVVRSFHSPWLGFAVMSRPEIAKVRGIKAYQEMPKPRNGILIEGVFDPSPAFLSGIKPNDWLVTFNKTRIFTPVDFQRQLYLNGIGSSVRVEICRDGKLGWHEIKIEERPAAARPR